MIRRSIVFAFVSMLIAGCTPSPEKVCGKVKTLAEKADEKVTEKDVDRCKSQLVDMQKENKEGFECLSKCVMSADSFEAATRGCDKECKDKLHPKKKKGDDEAEPKKKKSSDDDDTDSKKKKSSDDDDDTSKKSKKKSADDDDK